MPDCPFKPSSCKSTVQQYSLLGAPPRGPRQIFEKVYLKSLRKANFLHLEGEGGLPPVGMEGTAMVHGPAAPPCRVSAEPSDDLQQTLVVPDGKENVPAEREVDGRGLGSLGAHTMGVPHCRLVCILNGART